MYLPTARRCRIVDTAASARGGGRLECTWRGVAGRGGAWRGGGEQLVKNHSQLYVANVKVTPQTYSRARRRTAAGRETKIQVGAQSTWRGMCRAGAAERTLKRSQRITHSYRKRTTGFFPLFLGYLPIQQDCILNGKSNSGNDITSGWLRGD